MWWSSILLGAIILSAPPRPPHPPSIASLDDGEDNDYSVGIIDLPLMNQLLGAWDSIYRRRDAHSELFHAICWPPSPTPRACFGILRDNSICGLVQIEYNVTPPLILRGVACAPDEMCATSLLLQLLLGSDNFTVDWTAMRQQPRWYVAMKMYSSTNISVGRQR